eukprot:m.7539 g.7539  ORF g.7539 m.7539 type:complete len:343 (+) comp18947_c0_seq1:16-1044(+)
MTSKQYGLIIPKKKAAARPAMQRPSIFDDSGDEDDAAKARAAVNETVSRESAKNSQSKQVHREMAKALDEDPTVYDYDAVYDAMQEKKRAGAILKEKDRKPKYIDKLKRAAEKRKIDYERMVERKAQREREKEGDKFDDKEAFVTTAYKEKMKRLAEEEEKEKKKDALESANDVMKQQDLSRFYHNLLRQNVSKGAYNVQGADEPTKEDTKDVKEADTKEKEKEVKDGRKEEESVTASDHGTASNDSDDVNDAVDDERQQSHHDDQPDRRSERKRPQKTEERQIDSEEATSIPEPSQVIEKPPQSKIQRRNNEVTVSAARERYLARKLERQTAAAENLQNAK